jgi:hypothetical protein
MKAPKERLEEKAGVFWAQAQEISPDSFLSFINPKLNFL